MKTSACVKELQAQSVEQLQAQLVDAKKELFNLRFQNATNQLDNTARIKEVRKNIARNSDCYHCKGCRIVYPIRKEILDRGRKKS